MISVYWNKIRWNANTSAWMTMDPFSILCITPVNPDNGRWHINGNKTRQSFRPTEKSFEKDWNIGEEVDSFILEWCVICTVCNVWAMTTSKVWYMHRNPNFTKKKQKNKDSPAHFDEKETKEEEKKRCTETCYVFP